MKRERRQQQTLIRQVLRDYREALLAPKETVAEIEYAGSAIRLPQGMELKKAIQSLQRRLQYEEEVTEINEVVDAFPWDAAYALQQAINEQFGWSQAEWIPGGWFAPDEPPQLMSIEIGFNETVHVPWGRFTLPNIKGFIQTGHTRKGNLVVFQLTAQVLRKHEKAIKRLAERTREIVREQSIYRGKAIKVRFTDEHSRAIELPVPKFLDVSNALPSRLVFSDHVYDSIATNLYTPIERYAELPSIKAPFKRGVLLSGDYGCLAGDTMIGVNRGGKGFQIRLDALVARINGETSKGNERWNPEIPTYVQRAELGIMRLAKITGAWRSGLKETFTVTTDSGRTIRGTDEHPFLTEDGYWKRLDELEPGTRVCVLSGQTHQGRVERDTYEHLAIKNHPFAKRTRTAAVVAKHRLVAEADLNGFSDLQSYQRTLEAEGPAGFQFLDPTTTAVHHVDLNPRNNELGNLAVLSHAEHHRIHAVEHGTARNVQWKIGAETIVSIQPYGEEVTYDIEVEDDPHNFIANGFVVHNTGKTELAFTAAHLATLAHITFLYCEVVTEFAQAIQFAQQYAPAIVFCEDIDRVSAGGERTDAVNAVLNTMDGIEAKGTQVMVVLTSNNANAIYQGMVRPGRIDAVIEIERPDPSAVQGLIRLYARDLLDPAEDLGDVGELLNGQIPSVVQEVVERSKLAALRRTERGGTVRLSGPALAESARTMAKQVALLERKPTAKPSDVENAGHILGRYVADGMLVASKLLIGQERATVERVAQDGNGQPALGSGH